MMLRFFSILIGLLLTSTSLAAGSQTQFKVYERIKEKYLQQYYLEGSEEDVREFIARQLKDVEPVIVPENEKPSPLTKDDVKTALEGKKEEFCKSRKLGRDVSCDKMYEQIRTLASDLGRIRGLGRDLLATAAGYELGVNGFFGEPLELGLRFPSVIRLWQSGSDHLFSPPVENNIRGNLLPENMDSGVFSTLEEDLSDLEEETGPAVWRYRYGLRSVEKEGACDDKKKGADELFMANTQRWCDIEKDLQKIADALPKNPKDYDPPLKPGETVIFPIKRSEDVPNVVIWMTTKVVFSMIVTDAGISWDIPMEPVLPGLLAPDDIDDCEKEMGNEDYCKIVEDKKILPGGLYPLPPKEPGDAQGVCAHVIARSGYLCRPMDMPSCEQKIKREKSSASPSSSGQSSGKAGPRSIVLTKCPSNNFKGPIRTSNTGPSLCDIGWWRNASSSAASDPAVKDTPNQDPKLALGTCDNCMVDIVCSDSVPGGFTGVAYPKNEKGITRIVFSNSAFRPELRGTLLHELVHAQQFCSLNQEEASALLNAPETCCALEHEAYMVYCSVLAEEGVLPISGVSVDACASVMSNHSCAKFGKSTCSEINQEKVLFDRMGKAMEQVDKKYPKELNCKKIVGDLPLYEPRAAAMKESLKKTCYPGCASQYENTLGNNLCYLDRCVEDSLEFSRLIPGRMTEGVQDESYPWDSCAAQDPRNGKLLLAPIISPVELPPYNPGLLVQTLDTALCQLNGLPALTPPVLCGFSAMRRFNAPMEGDVLGFILGFGNQQGESIGASYAMQGMAQGTAVRLGTTMTLEYLERSLRSLTEIMSAANTLLKQIAQIRFPMSTCPRKAADGNVCSQFQ